MTTLNAIEMVYPPSPENEWMAERLKKELSSYRIPSAVRKRTGILKLTEVQTPALIVFCMPESIGDPEVEKAIGRYTREGLSNRIIALILGGAAGNRFPDGLIHQTLPDGTVAEREPLAANISAPTRRGMLKKLETEKLRIIASILGVAFDDLRNRRRRQRMRIAAAAGTVLFCGAAAFLFYALSRVRVMSGQQAELTLQLEQARAAENEEERRKTEEEEAFAGTISVQAREALESGDSELALLLCRELLPEMRRVPALTEVFREALEKLCGKGYVPVTDCNSYARDRYGAEPSEVIQMSQEKSLEQFPERLFPPVPEGLGCDKEYAAAFIESWSGEHESWSEEYCCAAYRAYFTPLDERQISCTWVHFPEAPERDYYLKDREGNYLLLYEDLAFLPDGTFLGIGEKDGLAYRVRIDGGEILPFFDAETEGVTETASGGYVLLHKVGGFRRPEGADVVLGIKAKYDTQDYVDVYSVSPLLYLETLEDMNKLQDQKGMNYLFGSSLGRIPLSVFRKEPFSFCFTLKAGSEEKVSQYPRSEAVRLPDGREILMYEDECIYSLPEGELLYDLHGKGFEGVKKVDAGISSEGWFALNILEEKVFWDAASGRETGRIPNKEGYYLGPDNSFFGPRDPESGCCSASAYLMGGIVWEYREKARDVPEDLEGQIALAEELLQGRELTQRERDKYHLD